MYALHSKHAKSSPQGTERPASITFFRRKRGYVTIRCFSFISCTYTHYTQRYGSDARTHACTTNMECVQTRTHRLKRGTRNRDNMHVRPGPQRRRRRRSSFPVKLISPYFPLTGCWLAPPDGVICVRLCVRVCVYACACVCVCFACAWCACQSGLQFTWADTSHAGGPPFLCGEHDARGFGASVWTVKGVWKRLTVRPFAYHMPQLNGTWWISDLTSKYPLLKINPL